MESVLFARGLSPPAAQHGRRVRMGGKLRRHLSHVEGAGGTLLTRTAHATREEGVVTRSTATRGRRGSFASSLAAAAASVERGDDALADRAHAAEHDHETTERRRSRASSRRTAVLTTLVAPPAMMAATVTVCASSASASAVIAAPPTARASPAPAEWGYADSSNGPLAWGSLKNPDGSLAYPACGCAACAQSPVDLTSQPGTPSREGSLGDAVIPPKKPVTLSVAQKHGTPNFTAVDAPDVESRGAVVADGKTYAFASLHFHTPAENTVDGRAKGTGGAALHKFVRVTAAKTKAFTFSGLGFGPSSSPFHPTTRPRGLSFRRGECNVAY